MINHKLNFRRVCFNFVILIWSTRKLDKHRAYFTIPNDLSTLYFNKLCFQTKRGKSFDLSGKACTGFFLTSARGPLTYISIYENHTCLSVLSHRFLPNQINQQVHFLLSWMSQLSGTAPRFSHTEANLHTAGFAQMCTDLLMYSGRILSCHLCRIASYTDQYS